MRLLRGLQLEGDLMMAISENNVWLFFWLL